MEQIFSEISKVLETNLKAKLREKGHVATGKGVESIEVICREIGKGFVIEILGESYLIPQNEGRKPGKRPHSSVLEEWVRIKGLATELKEVKRISFLIARNMGEIGMHSDKKKIDLSKRKFVEEGIEASDLNPYFQKYLDQKFEIVLQNAYNKMTTNLIV
jgi:hypothetical protein